MADATCSLHPHVAQADIQTRQDAIFTAFWQTMECQASQPVLQQSSNHLTKQQAPRAKKPRMAVGGKRRKKPKRRLAALHLIHPRRSHCSPRMQSTWPPQPHHYHPDLESFHVYRRMGRTANAPGLHIPRAGLAHRDISAHGARQ
ncbi:Hypothetical predicted protein, partial [Pelobates cultripes]